MSGSELIQVLGMQLSVVRGRIRVRRRPASFLGSRDSWDSEICMFLKYGFNGILCF